MKKFLFFFVFTFLVIYPFSSFSAGYDDEGFLVGKTYCSSERVHLVGVDISHFYNLQGTSACADSNVLHFTTLGTTDCPDLVYDTASYPLSVGVSDSDDGYFHLTYTGISFDNSLCDGGGGGTSDNGTSGDGGTGGTSDNGTSGDGANSIATEDTQKQLLDSVKDLNNTLMTDNSTHHQLSSGDFDTSISNIPQQKDISSIIDNFISDNPLISAISGSKLQLSNQQCSFSVNMFNRDIKIDFCRSEVSSALDIFGSIIVAISGLLFLFIAFG